MDCGDLLFPLILSLDSSFFTFICLFLSLALIVFLSEFFHAELHPILLNFS